MAATKKAKTPSTLDYVHQALEDLDKARHRATEEVRENIDRAVERLRESVKDARSRASEQSDEFEEALAKADETARRELGRMAIRAQRTEAALSEMTREIRARKAELAAGEGPEA